jgi:hypothetical protein
MSASAGHPFRALAAEALVDAGRRRIVPVIAVVSLLSLLAVNSCTSCTPTFTVDGEVSDTAQIAGWSGMVMLAALSLWTVVLAGVLASDHLARTLSEGTAALVLARPVGRHAFALARLAGALGVAFATGAVLLGGAAALIHLRLEVGLGPAAWAALACAGGAVAVAALAMMASLFLPQTATVLLVLVSVGAITSVNLLAQFGAHPGTVAEALERFGPPLCTAVLIALAPWIEPVAVSGDPLAIAARLALWAAGSAVLLAIVFRRHEIS